MMHVKHTVCVTGIQLSVCVHNMAAYDTPSVNVSIPSVTEQRFAQALNSGHQMVYYTCIRIQDRTDLKVIKTF